MHKTYHNGCHCEDDLPESPVKVHLMGICGTGMAALAGMFRELGCVVGGSDQGVYPPMSDFLRQMGIEIREGYRPENLHPAPDLVVVGNVIRRVNPEAAELERSGIPFTSMPGALRKYFIMDKTRIVVAGTHGKTTVSSMIAWILFKEALDPGFMIGGIPGNFGKNYRIGKGRHFVIEGDEYDTAYFDKRPKFLHYQPDVAVITSCEFDHGDIFSDLQEIQDQFRAFGRLVPPEGRLIAFGDDALVRDITSAANGQVRTYGFGPLTDWRATDVEDVGAGIAMSVAKGHRIVAQGTLPVLGLHNVSNAVAAVAVAEAVGVDPQDSLNALSSFAGVRRRQEIVGQAAGIVVIDDFAHHPSEVRETCAAVRARFPGRRLVAAFEPRTNTSRRAFFQASYVPAFQSADLIAVREPRDPEKFPEADRFSSERLAVDLRSLGKQASAFEDTDRLLEFLSTELRESDVVLVMSNGNFDNIASRLVDALEEREK